MRERQKWVGENRRGRERDREGVREGAQMKGEKRRKRSKERMRKVKMRKGQKTVTKRGREERGGGDGRRKMESSR